MFVHAIRAKEKCLNSHIIYSANNFYFFIINSLFVKNTKIDLAIKEKTFFSLFRFHATTKFTPLNEYNKSIDKNQKKGSFIRNDNNIQFF